MVHTPRNAASFPAGDFPRCRNRTTRWELVGTTMRKKARPALLKGPGAGVEKARCRAAAGYLISSGAMTTLMTLISLIRMLRLGPLVSLNGSPTVSPTTAAL